MNEDFDKSGDFDKSSIENPIFSAIDNVKNAQKKHMQNEEILARRYRPAARKIASELISKIVNHRLEEAMQSDRNEIRIRIDRREFETSVYDINGFYAPSSTSCGIHCPKRDILKVASGGRGAGDELSRQDIVIGDAFDLSYHSQAKLQLDNTEWCTPISFVLLDNDESALLCQDFEDDDVTFYVLDDENNVLLEDNEMTHCLVMKNEHIIFYNKYCSEGSDSIIKIWNSITREWMYLDPYYPSSHFLFGEEIDCEVRGIERLIADFDSNELHAMVRIDSIYADRRLNGHIYRLVTWNLESGCGEENRRNERWEKPNSVLEAISPDGEFLAYANGNNLEIISTDDGSTIRHIDLKDWTRDGFKGYFTCVFFEKYSNLIHGIIYSSQSSNKFFATYVDESYEDGEFVIDIQHDNGLSVEEWNRYSSLIMTDEQYFIPFFGTISIGNGIGPEQYSYIHDEIVSMVEETGLEIESFTNNMYEGKPGLPWCVEMVISGIQDL